MVECCSPNGIKFFILVFEKAGFLFTRVTGSETSRIFSKSFHVLRGVNSPRRIQLRIASSKVHPSIKLLSPINSMKTENNAGMAIYTMF